jgi:hypothetical protein
MVDNSQQASHKSLQNAYNHAVSKRIPYYIEQISKLVDDVSDT